MKVTYYAQRFTIIDHKVCYNACEHGISHLSKKDALINMTNKHSISVQALLQEGIIQ